MKRLKNFFCMMMTVLMVLILVPAGFVHAANNGEPIREAHRVKAGDTKYCFFVTHNVVLTPKEVSKMNDSELSQAVIARSGLYMMKTNCRKTGKVITVKEWRKSRGLFLDKADIDRIRNAEVSDGNPEKLHMDVRLTAVSFDPYEKTGEEDKKDDEKKDEDKKDEEDKDTKAEDGKDDKNGETDQNAQKDETDQTGQIDEKDQTGQEDEKDQNDPGSVTDPDGKKDEDSEEPEEPVEPEEPEDIPDIYSTYKLLSPELIFVVVASEGDAKAAEDACKAEKPVDPAPHEDNTPSVPDGGGEAEEMLPELRTINMADRSGKPVEDTLKDGDPVALEWIEPSGLVDIEKSKSFIEHIPGGYISLAALAAVAAVVAVIIVGRKKRNEDE